jgi:hypothetical protein
MSTELSFTARVFFVHDACAFLAGHTGVDHDSDVTIMVPLTAFARRPALNDLVPITVSIGEVEHA